MANYLKQDLIDRVKELTLQYKGVREIRRELGMHSTTIRKYRELSGVDKIKCGCGRTIYHRGWCSIRYDKSPMRQEFMAKWHGKKKPEPVIENDNCSIS